MKRVFSGCLGLVLILATAVPAAGRIGQNIDALKRTAEAGDRAAQYRLGLAYRDGTGLPKDAVRAYFWLSMAVAFGTGDVREGARAALNGVTNALTDADRRRAEQIGVDELQRLADDGRAWAQAWLGAAYQIGSAVTPRDPALALRWLEKAAAQGDSGAQFMLGLSFLRGDGVPADAKRAMALLRSAAGQGHTKAQVRLGSGYFDGTGVLQDYAEAVRWWRLAADQGDDEAQANLGDLYRLGDKGVAQDYQESARWYRSAAEQGHAVAQSNLGTFYERGLGVPQDLLQAVKWYTQAARQGYPLGQYNLGRLLEHGQGVLQNRIEAHKWMNLAAARASSEYQPSFAEGRDRVAASMSPADIAEAQKRAREWLEAFDRGAELPVPPPPPPAAPETPIRTGGAIATPARLKYVEPVYPPVAISARIQGVVIVEATIGPDGRVTDAKILRSPSPLLDAAALDAVRKWEYAQTLLNGVAVPVIMTVTVTFALK